MCSMSSNRLNLSRGSSMLPSRVGCTHHKIILIENRWAYPNTFPLPSIPSRQGRGDLLEFPPPSKGRENWIKLFFPLHWREGARGWGNLHNRLKQFAGNLRNNPTDVERLLWQRLKSSQVEGIKFRRQQVLEDFIVDFVSFEKKIVIELDGGQHAETIEKDKRRDDCLIMNGYKVLRFWDNEVIQNMEGVLEVIRRTCLNR